MLEEDEADLVQSAIEFNDITASEVLTPRVDICAISKNATKEEILEMFLQYNYSRMPVYEGSVDKIIGFIPLIFPPKNNLCPIPYFVISKIYSNMGNITALIHSLNPYPLYFKSNSIKAFSKSFFLLLATLNFCVSIVIISFL